MRQAFTPEALFRVSTLGMRVDTDPYVAPGAQLRAWVNPAVGFPLRGITFLPLRAQAIDPGNGSLVRPLLVHWWVYDDDGVPQSLGTDLDVPVKPDRPLYGDIVELQEAVGTKDPWISWIRVEVDEDSPVRLSVVGRTGGAHERILVSRSQKPFALAASRIRRIRLTGEGRVRSVIGLDAGLATREHIDYDNRIRIGLPLEQVSEWADPVDGSGGGMDRVTRGAPWHTGPQEVPTDTDGDEAARVQKLLDGVGETSVQLLLERAYADPGSYPGRHVTPLEIRDVEQKATTELGSVETLITAAADPGIARWLGLSTPVDADISDDSVPVGWIAVGTWAADPAARVAAGTTVADLVTTMNAAGPDKPTLAPWVALAGERPVDQQLLNSCGVVKLTLVTPAVIGALPDLPDAPSPALDGPPTWGGTDIYRQDIALLGTPPAGPVAFTRTVDGAVASQHAFIDVDGTPRALTLLAGRRELNTGCQGALVDSTVPAAKGPVAWYVAESDEFGRWGPPGTLDAVPPPRPLLPPPAPQAYFLADHTLRDAPPGLRVPGTITVAVDVPAPDTLGPGTPPITRVSIDGQAYDAPFPEDRLQVSFPAAPTQLGQVRDQSVTVVFNPDTEQRSTAAKVHVVDPRRPTPLSTAPRLLWSSRRDPVGAAQIDLSWPTEPGHAAYNVYLADERVVTAQLHVFPASPNRATRAAALYDHQHQHMARESFTLLTPAPLPAGGTVRFAHTLPGSLQTLQFLRIVPLTGAQVEANFDACGLTPAAVPGGDQPPAPLVRVDAGGGSVRVQVEAHGINAHVIERLGSQSPPEYRVRCTAAATSYLYGSTVDEGHLVEVAGTPDTYTAVVPDEKLASLPPFVPLGVTAQVRYPAEVSTEPGAAPLPSPIVTTAGLIDAQPADWSAPSAPVIAMTTAPTPDLDVEVRRDGAGVALTVRNLPPQHTLQVKPWRLYLWRVMGDGELRSLAPGDADIVVDPVAAPPGEGWEFTSATVRVRDGLADVAGYATMLLNPLDQAGPLTRHPVQG